MEIAIIGGGITGLTTALALHKLGFKATVYERASELNEIGAGIWLQPNAMKICEWLGIKNQIVSAGNKIDKMEIAYPTLIPIREIKQEVVQDEFGNQTIAIHRGKLQSILYEEFQKVGEIELGMEYLSQEAVNGKTKIHFTDRIVEADLVFGTDGINSKVRHQLFGDTVLRDSQQICYRGISDYSLPTHLVGKGKELWGKKIRFGFSNISATQVYWFAVADKNKYSADIAKQDLMGLYKGFDPLVTDLIKNTSTWNAGILKDLQRIPTWHHGQTCLLGDAAHATTPNMGQGACQGIEDAYYISNILARSQNPQEAFKTFEFERREKVDRIVNTSWSFGKMAHNPFAQSMLKLIMKISPQSVMTKQMNMIYAVKEY